MTKPVDSYQGKQIRVLIHPGRCIHSRNCVLGRPSVFIPNAVGDWVRPDQANVEEVVALAKSCPSGAIGYERQDGGPQESPPEVNTVRVRENGPLAVHAELNLGGDRGSYRATLCRCGASRHKPYCDGTHAEIGFSATGEPPHRKSPPLESQAGPLNVTPAPNGPLILEGPVEVCSGTGRTVSRETRVALCRCGASASKPYCDGSHSRIGFNSDA